MRGCPDPNLERRSKSDCAFRSRLIGRDVHLLISPAIPATLQWGINGRLMAGKRKSCREHGFALPPDTILSGMNGPPLMDGVNSLRVSPFLLDVFVSLSSKCLQKVGGIFSHFVPFRCAFERLSDRSDRVRQKDPHIRSICFCCCCRDLATAKSRKARVPKDSKPDSTKEPVAYVVMVIVKFDIGSKTLTRPLSRQLTPNPNWHFWNTEGKINRQFSKLIEKISIAARRN
ncbi:hypothetical protein AVEN_5457-1 [Araneus ventricosus]|uniref:Uncharacterized protein n=1 Tax=Araneus ventricosus TaxID=182803 RepID=A0A4Y2DZD9_ARAVE|nr:hypothetical protein AVEN_5457-1 [Araneus ventricosus]